MDYQTLVLNGAEVAEHGAIMIITLNRPQALNAMNTQMFLELREVIRSLRDDPVLRCVIVTGAGDRAFSVGGDLKERDGMDDDTWRRQHELIEEVFLSVKDFPQPVIAAVEGHAHGGGCELALMCDFVVASESAKFSLPEVRRGIMPGGGGVQNLARAVGLRLAKQYLYTGDMFDAKAAQAMGMINEITPVGGALAMAVDIGCRIVSAAPMSVRYLKVAASRGVEVDFHTGYALDITAYNVLVSSQDRLEGVAAFNAKRPPRWKNH